MLQAPQTCTTLLTKWQPKVCLLLLDILPADLKNLGPNGQVPPYVNTNGAILSEGELRSRLSTQPWVDEVELFLDQPDLHATKLVGRIFVDDSATLQQIKPSLPKGGLGPPEEVAQFHHNIVMAARGRLNDHRPALADRVDFWVLCNEILGGNSADLSKLCAYEKKRLDLAAGHYGCGLFAFANGNPLIQDSEVTKVGGDQDFDEVGTERLFHWKNVTPVSDGVGGTANVGIPIVLETAENYNMTHSSHPHAMLLHQYFKPDPDPNHTWVRSDMSLTELNYSKFVGRFESHVHAWFAENFPHVKTIITEYGADGRIHLPLPAAGATMPSRGWKYYPEWRGPQNEGRPYLQVLKDLEVRNRPFEDVILGYCLFGLGINAELFWSYRLDAGPISGQGGAGEEAHIADALAAHALAVRTGQVPPVASDPTKTNGVFANLAVNHDGRFTLARTADLVSATFSSSRSPVQYLARQSPAVLFVVPKGFRPAAAETWTVSGARHVTEKGEFTADASESPFMITVGLDGAVTYVNNAMVDHLGYMRFSVSVTWSVPAAITTPAQPAPPPDASVAPVPITANGVFTNLALSHDGRFALSRTADLVMVTISTSRSPVQYLARQNPTVLFVVPKDFRPAAITTLTVSGARHVAETGEFTADTSEPPFKIAVGTDGAVTYVNDALMDHLGFVRFSISETWESS